MRHLATALLALLLVCPAAVADEKQDAETLARTAEEAVAKGDRAALEALVRRGSRGGTDRFSLRYDFARAQAYLALGQADAARVASVGVAERAEQAPWLDQARLAWDHAAKAAMAIPNRALSIAHMRSRIAVERRRNVPADLAQGLRRLAILESDDEQPKEAEAHAREALAIYRQTGDRHAEGMALGTLGILQYEAGAYDAAIATTEQGRRIFEERKDVEHAARLLGNIAAFHNRAGRHRKAIAAFEASIALRKQVGDEVGSVSALTGIAVAYWWLGEYFAAQQAYTEAWQRSQPLDDDQTKLAIQNGFGLLAMEQRDFAVALEHHRKALVYAERLQSRREGLGLRVNMASILIRLERLDDAQAVIDAGRKLAQGLSHLLQAARMHEIQAWLHEAREDAVRAIESYGFALTTFRFTRNAAGEARVLRSLGMMQALLARRRINAEQVVEPAAREALFAQALRSQEASLDIARRLDDPDAMVLALSELGGILGDVPAHERLRKVVDEVIALEPRLARRGSQEQWIRRRETLPELYYQGFWSAGTTGDLPRAWHMLERARGRALLAALANREAIRTRRIPPELRDAETEARAAQRNALARVRRARRGKRLKEIRSAQKQAEEATAAAARVVTAIQRERRAAAALLQPVPASLGDVRAELEPGVGLLSLSVVPQRGAAAMLATRDDLRMLGLFGLEGIEDVVRSYVHAASDDEAFAALDRAVVVLRQMLPLGTKVKRLLVSPDGLLAYVPWALVYPEIEVTFVPSGTIWKLLAAEAARRGKGVLALGNPDYGKAAPQRRGKAAQRAGSHWARLAPLPATGAEALAVGSVVLLNAGATEAALRERIPQRERWRAIHFACHGLIDAKHPMLSCLAVTAAPPDDGFLTAAEIFELDTPADLVVLSACETGRGKAWYGEGVVGLTQAFLFAGAPRVLCSLWKVDDEATSALMTKFYALWNPTDATQGLTAAAALKAAQAHIRAQPRWSHPRYWAAWVLWGRHD